MGFKKDPTHKTYVSRELLDRLLERNKLNVRAFYYHPFNLPGVDKYFYLNMQVFEIGRAPELVGKASNPSLNPSMMASCQIPVGRVGIGTLRKLNSETGSR
jgi:hypothetical protein